MKIVFMGTPDFAVPTLCNISTSTDHEIIAVVTNPDKPQGRGRKLTPSPVKIAALELEIPVIQPVNLNENSFIEELKGFNADAFVVVAFRILPDSVIGIPKYGAINLHSSLLPKYRGSAPIEWAIINGDIKTGVSIMKIDSGIDTGAVFMQKEVAINESENCGELSERLSHIGAELMVEALGKIENGNIEVQPQDSERSSRAPKITPDTMKIDWTLPAENIVNLIRGLAPDRAAFTQLGKHKLKIYSAEVVTDTGPSGKPGEIISADKKNGLSVMTGRSVLRILILQKEGKKKMDAADFLRGSKIDPGTILV